MEIVVSGVNIKLDCMFNKVLRHVRESGTGTGTMGLYEAVRIPYTWHETWQRLSQRGQLVILVRRTRRIKREVNSSATGSFVVCVTISKYVRTCNIIVFIISTLQ